MTVGDWQKTACILCECNCGIEVRLGEDGRTFERIRGDKAHPASQGYTCEKALRLDHYQNGQTHLRSPLRRRDDGTFEEIDWDTAISEVAERFAAVRDEFGGPAIFYYGGGGQGNHLGGSYSGATLRALGARFRSNALAQEKTGEFWVNGRMLGTAVRADFEHTDLALFIGKNPYQSHGIARARTTLKEIARDESRQMIVIDPRVTETAELADVHLQVRPGTDAWCLAALVAVIVQDDLVDRAFLSSCTDGFEAVSERFAALPVAEYAQRCGVSESLIRDAARRIAAAPSVAAFEDLGVQMGRHSTLCSYLEKLVWLLTGNFAKPGSQYTAGSLVSLVRNTGKDEGVSPVAGARIISGLVPCNVISEEILTDHPARYRAMLVESGNPAHSLADSPRMREALAALELLVVIDVSMTETARLAHYVLPAPTQFEKHEATFFNFEFPNNVFHLRRPVVPAPDGPLPEPEIHARLVEALGLLPESVCAPLREAAEQGRAAFADAFFAATAADPMLGAVAPVVLYRTLGPTLTAPAAAILWGAAHRCAMASPAAVLRAMQIWAADHPELCTFDPEALDGLALGEALFDAILASPSGLVFLADEWESVWSRVSDGRVHLAVPEMLDLLADLDEPPVIDPQFPLVLSAGERRSFTANTIIRDPAWRKRDAGGALRVNADDARSLGLVSGDRARLSTRRATVEVTVEVHPSMQPGHISLPNGLGLDEVDENGRLVRTGVAPNDLTSYQDRDPVAGTPWHKNVPARLEPV